MCRKLMASELIKYKDKFRLPECQRNLDNDQVNKMWHIKLSILKNIMNTFSYSYCHWSSG